MIRFIYNRFDAIFCKPTRTSIPQHGIEPVTPLYAHPLRACDLDGILRLFGCLYGVTELAREFRRLLAGLHHHGAGLAAATAFSDEIGRQLDNGLIGG